MLPVVANDAAEDLWVHQRPVEECGHRGRAFNGIDCFERHCAVVNTSLALDRERYWEETVTVYRVMQYDVISEYALQID